HVVPEAQPYQLPPGPAVAKRALPLLSIPADQVRAGQAGIVELPARLGGAEDGGGQPAGTVSIVERELPVTAGAHDQDGLLGFERLPPPLAGQREVSGRSRKHRGGGVACQQRV